jgi:alkylation response protein AidB-like acyl-CoA dehydrogenase
MAAERAAELRATSDEAFRAKLRAWLEANYPEQWRQDHHRPFRRLRGADQKTWIRMLDEAGWRCPAWPEEHGGLQLSFRKQAIYQEEIERARAARVIDLGEVQLGPTLMLYGTPAQKAHYLPRIRNGEHIWCQGYSEPNAGSDLASLRTTAERDGEVFKVNGQKIWTTHADEASHIFALVRTSKGPKKQQGITFLLMDMDTPGVTIRPIRNIAGEAEFCEVFFDNVEAPIANALGPVDQGWTVAKALLGYERIWIGSPAMAHRALALTRDLLDATTAGPELRDRYAELACDLHDLSSLYRQTCDAVAEDREPGPEVSILKVVASDLLQQITEFNVELAAEAAGYANECRIGDIRADIAWQFYMARPTTIFGGSNEIQKNIMARALLGLPAE